ncbi:hypothetical protein Taro_015708 [Colocasia esculenta]|uniref:Uncharacterized protein n=1 Tax=Colocasia esculenta TaxID=4460 RepID=A0A843ULX7_COLES|nr:hypothetical protein [Colocasia esculenta]
MLSPSGVPKGDVSMCRHLGGVPEGDASMCRHLGGDTKGVTLPGCNTPRLPSSVPQPHYNHNRGEGNM